MSSIDQATIDAVRKNQLVLDCIQMSLRPQSGGADRYTGGGVIRQTSEGRLEYVLYDTKADVSLEDIFGRVGVGEFFTADDFFTLTATDVNGNTWTAEWVDGSPSSVGGAPGAIVRGTFERLTRSDAESSSTSAFWGFAPAEARIPTNAVTETITKVLDKESKGWNTNIWNVDCGTAGTLRATQYDDGVQVRFEKDSPDLPPQMGVRLEEALTFILAAPINWLVEQTLAGGVLTVTIRARKTTYGQPRLPAPLPSNAVEARADQAEMLRKYLSYLLANPPQPDEYHPLAVSIARVIRSSGAALEDESLALVTEVESIVGSHFISRGQPTSAFVQAVDDVIKFLATWQGSQDPDALKRFMGVIKNLKGVNARNALHKLVDDKVIAKRHLDAWLAVRNPAAHGARSSRAARETFALNTVVHQLLLLLVFEIIGYKGRFMDRTAKNFPLTTAADSAKT